MPSISLNKVRNAIKNNNDNITGPIRIHKIKILVRTATVKNSEVKM